MLAAYSAMATPEERAVLLGRPRNEAQSMIIVRKLGQLLISRFVAAYRDKNTTVPQRIESGSLLFNSVIEHLTKTKLLVDSMAFSEWRKAGASKATGAVAASSQPSAAAASAPAAADVPDDDDEEGPLRKSPRPLGASVSRVQAASAAEGSGSSSSSPEDDGLQQVVLSDDSSPEDDGLQHDALSDDDFDSENWTSD